MLYVKSTIIASILRFAEIHILLKRKLDILSRVHRNLPSVITLLYIWVLYLFVSRLCHLLDENDTIVICLMEI